MRESDARLTLAQKTCAVLFLYAQHGALLIVCFHALWVWNAQWAPRQQPCAVGGQCAVGSIFAPCAVGALCAVNTPESFHAQWVLMRKQHPRRLCAVGFGNTPGVYAQATPQASMRKQHPKRLCAVGPFSVRWTLGSRHPNDPAGHNT